MRRSLRLAVLAASSALVSLGAGELAFRFADDGAFPHLNVYEADAALGARLRPGATERVSFLGNPVTDVRINGAGFRGADWSPPAAGEVVMVGDSQVFGLGVEENETIAAGLAAATGRSVLNAGVPTYGPEEYLAVIARLLQERKPAMVVLVVNASNDFFEIGKPNRDRHRVWDGWAVRAETMPQAVTDFPGRSWLFGQSHLVFALRRSLYVPPEGLGGGLPSEGNLDDLVGSTAPSAGAAPSVSVAGEMGDAAARRARAHAWLVSMRYLYGDGSGVEDLALQALARHNQPGDIVFEGNAESARSVPVTAELLRRAAAVRASAVDDARKWVAAHPDHPRAAEVRASLTAYDEGQAVAERLAAEVDVVGSEPSSLLGPTVLAARDLCAAAGAELVVAALPLDVQVSSEEWAKYGAEPRDMGPTRALLSELVAVATRAGVRAVDLTDPLAAAEPGAFLDGDLHLSPKGTRAVAGALAATLGAPAPIPYPSPGLPAGRSRLPSPDELTFAPEITVKGSSRNRCSTRQLREWFYVECAGLFSEYGGLRIGSQPSFHVVDAPLERAWMHDAGAARLLLPLIPGRGARVAFSWPKISDRESAAGSPWVGGRREDLVVTWEGDRAVIRFESASGAVEADGHDFPGDRGCFEASRRPPTWANLDRGCGRTFADDCASARVCASGGGIEPPACAEGEAAAGSSGWCYARCGPTLPCVEGVCTAWQGAQLCL
jgi:hypothetical protein